MSIHVTVWNENRTKKSTQKMSEVYPAGIHGFFKSVFEKAGFEVRIALLDDEAHGLADEVLEWTDVLVYWSHFAQDELDDRIADRIVERVNRGMGFIPLHSAHMCKPFIRLMGTSCTLNWRQEHDKEVLWSVAPGHPVLDGVPPYILLPQEEMYGEYFDVPEPEETILISWYEGGEVFRSGICYRRGRGRIFYFQPGHETYPTYKNTDIQRILINAVKWAAPTYIEGKSRVCRNVGRVV